ncbi:MAG TPA: hypothetical protein VN610_11235 [Bryobacteraceae bacterium]|nr:hypothetical protein [Bryobacteraceae bacterium]
MTKRIHHGALQHPFDRARSSRPVDGSVTGLRSIALAAKLACLPRKRLGGQEEISPVNRKTDDHLIAAFPPAMANIGGS